MKFGFKSAITILCLGVCFAFTTTNDGLNATYGVSSNDPSAIELDLNSDFTFTYQDHSLKDDKVDVQGTYTLENNRVQLVSDQGRTDFHNNWKIVEDGQAAKSRKGLSFYTLRRK